MFRRLTKRDGMDECDEQIVEIGNKRKLPKFTGEKFKKAKPFPQTYKFCSRANENFHSFQRRENNFLRP